MQGTHFLNGTFIEFMYVSKGSKFSSKPQSDFYASHTYIMFSKLQEIRPIIYLFYRHALYISIISSLVKGT